MEVNEYIESGILELYVFGITNESENAEVLQMSEKHAEVRNEILSIEKSVISLSYSMAPYLSAQNFDKIRGQLLEKHKVIEMKPRSNWPAYLGWAAAIVLMLGAGYQYTQLNDTKNQVATAETEKSKLNQDLNALKIQNQNTETVVAVLRDENNIVVPLGGQAVAPQAKAKIYWNKNTQEVYVDASGLPTPPEGKVYQIWSLKLNPLTPTSIGLLDHFAANGTKVFAVQSTTDAQAFGITLEPAGGSASPTMEQLYTLGAIAKA